MPLFFSWLGRLSAPLFLFCIIEGFIHTHDRKKYFLRIYLISIAMGLIQFSFYNVGSTLVRGDGFFPQNQMLASFSILLVVLQGIEWCQKKQWKKGLPAIILPIFLPVFYIAAFAFTANAPAASFVLNLLSFTVLPMHTAIIDGGTITLITGVLLYLFHKNRKLQAAIFVIVCIFWDIVRIFLLAPGLSFTDFFTQIYEWMEIFAVIPILCYNNTRGIGSQKFFYWFYPVHIYVLYALSCAIYRA